MAKGKGMPAAKTPISMPPWLQPKTASGKTVTVAKPFKAKVAKKK